MEWLRIMVEFLREHALGVGALLLFIAAVYVHVPIDADKTLVELYALKDR